MNLRTEVSIELVKRGYKRIGRVHLLRIDDDWRFNVDTGPIGSRSDIAPFVGLRNERVEYLVSKFMDLENHPTTGTVSANVGYILDTEYKRWDIPSHPQEVLDFIDKAFVRLKAFQSLELLPEAWQLKGTQFPGWQSSLAVTYLLNGNRKGLEDTLALARKDFCSSEDAACEQWRNFERRLNEYISPSKGGGH
jgi:hypothetical protein